MNFRLVFLLGAATLCLLPVLSCTSKPVENPDDVLPTPGGWAYRANIHEQGIENPWPPIETAFAVIGETPDPVEVSYRNNIDTKSGQTRNIIFWVTFTNLDLHPLTTSTVHEIALSVTSGDAPEDFKIILDGQGHGGDPQRRVQGLVHIEIPKNVKQGEYSFSFVIGIDGVEIGKVPCIVKVIS